MLRLLAALILMTGIGAFAAWITTQGGDVTLTWGDWEIRARTSVLLALFFITLLLGMLAYALFDTLWRAPKRLNAARRERNYAKGLQAVTETLSALMLADARAAEASLKRTQKHLGKAPVTLLLTAQAARLKGASDEARGALEALLKHDATRLLAARRLSEQNAEAGDLTRALSYAEQAYAARPNDPHAVHQLLGIYVLQKHYEQAHSLLARLSTRRAYTKKERARLEAFVLAHEAEEKLAGGEKESAAALARASYRLYPAHVPLIVLYARVLMALGDVGAAQNILTRAWKKSAHPELARELLKTLAHMPPNKRLKVAERLTAMHPESSAAQLLSAQAAYDMESLPSARAHAKMALAQGLTAQAALLMADIEEKEFADHDMAAHWRAKATSAPPGAHWQCERCGHMALDWSIHCGQCNSFDSLMFK